MNVGIAAATFGLVFVAELPDKTALASLLLGSKFRASYVFAGVAAAFAVHVVLALIAGRLLALLPHRTVELIVAGLFLVGAFFLVRHPPEEEEEAEQLDRITEPTFRRVAGTSFAIILLAEFGDLTQFVILNLAAKYHDRLAVGVGSLLALWAVAALAILGGRGLLRVVPVRFITMIGAAAMIALAIASIISAFNG